MSQTVTCCFDRHSTAATSGRLAAMFPRRGTCHRRGNKAPYVIHVAAAHDARAQAKDMASTKRLAKATTTNAAVPPPSYAFYFLMFNQFRSPLYGRHQADLNRGLSYAPAGRCGASTASSSRKRFDRASESRGTLTGAASRNLKGADGPPKSVEYILFYLYDLNFNLQKQRCRTSGEGSRGSCA